MGCAVAKTPQEEGAQKQRCEKEEDWKHNWSSREKELPGTCPQARNQLRSSVRLAGWLGWPGCALVRREGLGLGGDCGGKFCIGRISGVWRRIGEGERGNVVQSRLHPADPLVD